MRVEVYYNLHKNVFSVRHKGRVIQHTKMAVIKDAEYVVRPAGRAKVLREGKKNVHAFVRGEWLGMDLSWKPWVGIGQSRRSETTDKELLLWVIQQKIGRNNVRKLTV